MTGPTNAELELEAIATKLDKAKHLAERVAVRTAELNADLAELGQLLAEHLNSSAEPVLDPPPPPPQTARPALTQSDDAQPAEQIAAVESWADRTAVEAAMAMTNQQLREAIAKHVELEWRDRTVADRQVARIVLATWATGDNHRTAYKDMSRAELASMFLELEHIAQRGIEYTHCEPLLVLHQRAAELEEGGQPDDAA